MCCMFCSVILSVPDRGVDNSVVTYPLDITRTRLQIQGEKISRSVLQNVNRTSHRGMLQTMLGIGMY